MDGYSRTTWFSATELADLSGVRVHSTLPLQPGNGNGHLQYLQEPLANRSHTASKRSFTPVRAPEIPDSDRQCSAPSVAGFPAIRLERAGRKETYRRSAGQQPWQAFATIDAGSPWRQSKPCSASGPDVSPRHIRKYGAALKQNVMAGSTRIEHYRALLPITSEHIRTHPVAFRLTPYLARNLHPSNSDKA